MRQILNKTIVSLIVLLLGYGLAFSQDLSQEEVKALMENACSQYSDGNYQNALIGFEKVSEYAETHPQQVGHDVHFFCQEMSIRCFKYLERYEEAFVLAESVLKGELSEDDRKEIEQHYVTSGYCLALDYMRNASQRYNDARDMIARILPFAKGEMQDRIRLRQPMTWYLEGMQFQMVRNHEQALACIEEALRGFRAINAPDYEVEALLHIGELKMDLYDTIGALNAYHEADSLVCITKDDAKRAGILQEMRKLNEMLGDSESVWFISQQLDSLAAASKDPEVQFDYYVSKGNEARARRNFKMAENWYHKNDALINSDLGAGFRWEYLSKFQWLYVASGQLMQALDYAFKAKEEAQKGLDETNELFFYPYRGIADIYGFQGDSLRCFQYMDSLFMAEPLMDPSTAALLLYTSRGNCYAQFGNWEKALSDFKKAYTMISDQSGAESGDALTPLSRVAVAESRLKRYDQSEASYAQYAKLVASLVGEDTQNYIDALDYLANIQAFAGHLDEACRTYIDAKDRLTSQIRRKLPYCTSEERESFWAGVSTLIKDMTPFALEAKEYQTPFTQACYDGLILTKAFLLSSEQSTFDLIKDKGTSQDMADYASIQAMRAKLQVWEKEGASAVDSVLQVATRINQMEAALASRCRVYGDATSFMDIDYSRIQQSLGHNEVLLDFTDFVTKSRGRVYAAYIVDTSQQYPLLMGLFPERSIDSLNVRYPHQFYSGKYAERLLSLLWEPLRPYVKEGSTVYYVPAQLLYQIALESLPAGDGTLLGEHYHFVRLSSARELVRYDSKLNIDGDTKRNAAVLYGGLQYSLDGKTMAREALKHEVPRMLMFRGDDEHVRGDSLFYELPGSKEEIDGVGRILKAARLGVTPYSGKEGTEESFLSMSGKGPRMLHLATHGFYYTPDAAQKVNYLQGYTDAMSLSGLVLAGGNAAWLGQELPEGVMGGILTAAKIARMDLSGVEMVVLSACHSGKGEATPEGLYGLQRAFKKAGVKTIVMSLWAESDVVGPEFMKAFYQNLTGEALWDKRKAFDMARNTIRDQYPESPSYWAGFVMLD